MKRRSLLGVCIMHAHIFQNRAHRIPYSAVDGINSSQLAVHACQSFVPRVVIRAAA